MCGYSWCLCLTIILCVTTHCDSMHCQDYLISGPRGVPDSYMSASSVDNNCTTAARISLSNISSVWCPNTTNSSEYLQIPLLFMIHDIIDAVVDVGYEVLLDLYDYLSDCYVGCGMPSRRHLPPAFFFSEIKFPQRSQIMTLITEGHPNGSRVTAYNVQYSSDYKQWATIEGQNGYAKNFTGNVESSNKTNVTLTPSISVVYLRIIPTSWVQWPSLKLEVIGCVFVDAHTHRAPTSHQWEAFIHPGKYNVVPGPVWASVETNLWRCGKKCFEKSPCSSFTYNTNTKLCTAHREIFFDYSTKLFSNQPKDLSSRLYFTKVPWVLYGYEKLSSFHGAVKVHTYKTNNETAMTYCREEQSTLQPIQSKNQARVMWMYTRSNYILSLEDTFLVGGAHIENEWKLWNEDIIPENLWIPSHPNPHVGACVGLTEEGLRSVNCQTDYYFICGY